MRIKHGLTTWILSFGPLAVIWRLNMHCAEALRTATAHRYPAYCYVTAGPLILEWRRQRAAASDRADSDAPEER
jgi:hypothetical protein